jgi:hypothetical protein
MEDYSIFKLYRKRGTSPKKMKEEGELLLLPFKSMYASG